jgi:hypothetical protein
MLYWENDFLFHQYKINESIRYHISSRLLVSHRANAHAQLQQERRAGLEPDNVVIMFIFDLLMWWHRPDEMYWPSEPLYRNWLQLALLKMIHLALAHKRTKNIFQTLIIQ